MSHSHSHPEDLYKVVYNSCFGGFSLSKEAEEWICTKLHITALHAGVGMFEHLILSDVDAVTYEANTQRHSPLLVECVETLGSAKSSGRCASLQIGVIQGNQYFIEEYDGSESVITPADDIGKWTTI